MAFRHDGFERADFQRGFDLVYKATSRPELERLLDEHPVLESPVFHSTYRHMVRSAPHEANAEARYREFFAILHERAYRKLLLAEIKTAADSAPAPLERAPFAPEYFQALALAVGEHAPRPVEHPLRPESDGAVIHAELEALRGGAVTLPAYEPMHGSLWSAIVVTCARCHQRRLLVHAHRIDLVLAPDLVEPMRAGRLNDHRCPACGSDICAPEFVWVQEAPGAGDVLNSLASMWRVSSSTLIYCPPPGTRRVTANDRILEIRADELQHDLGMLDDEHAVEAIQQQGVAHGQIGFAYTTSDLVSFYEEANGDDSVPFAMSVLIQDFTQKLQAGLAPPTEIEAVLNRMDRKFFAGWPVFITPIVAGTNPYAALVQCLIVEACARANDVDLEIRARLAQQTAQAYLALNKLALAETAQSRAEDLFAALPDQQAQEHDIDLAIADERAGILLRSGEYAAAIKLWDELLRRIPSPVTLMDRVVWHQIAALRALALFRDDRLVEAFEAFQAETAALEALAQEAEHAEDQSTRDLSVVVQKSLSGALANWGSFIFELGDYMALAEHAVQANHRMDRQRKVSGQKKMFMRTWDAMPAQLRRLTREFGEDPERILRRAEVIPHLLAYLGRDGGLREPASSRVVRGAARAMIERALTISERIEEWYFAGRQSRRLANRMNEQGDLEHADRLMQRALEHATRVSDHETLLDAHLFFADRAGEQGDGVSALMHARNGVREAMRRLVGLGRHARDSERIANLGYIVLNCARFGADPVEAIVVAESLKAVSTTVSLAHGASGPEGVGDTAALSRLRDLETQREALRVESITRRARTADSEHRRRLRSLDEAIAEAREQARLRDPHYSRWCDATTVDVTDSKSFLQRLHSLGERATYIGFHQTADRVWAYAVGPHSAEVSWKPWPFHAAEDEREALEKARRFDAEAMQRWADLLLSPLEAYLRSLGPDDRLIISLHGQLGLLPYAALPFHRRRLCESARISYVQGIGVFEACRQRALSSFGSVLCLGDPTRPDMRELPAARREAETIGALFQSSGRAAEVLCGSRATIRGLAELIPQCDVLHIACHAIPESNAYPFPRLLLATALKEKDSGDLSEARILSELQLKSGTFVNLAGCATGIHADATGPTVRGLVPAFLVAGASAVLASAWPIDDEAAAMFNTDFYRRLLANSTPAASLAETQRACLAGHLGPRLVDPAHWAGYILFGAS